jgi:hypothetical protein
MSRETQAAIRLSLPYITGMYYRYTFVVRLKTCVSLLPFYILASVYKPEPKL